MNLSKKQIFKIKVFSLTLILIGICSFASIKFAQYLLIPVDKISEEVKEYYILSSSDYFKDKSLVYISLDNLIKSGYAQEKHDIIDNQCDKKSSYITKKDDVYYLTINCNNFISDLKIKGNL